METRKVNLDREKISSEEIQQKQDWNNVLGEARKLQPPLGRKLWYYGPAVLASAGVLISVTLFANSGGETESQVPTALEMAQIQVEETKVYVEKATINQEEVQVELKEEQSEEKIPLKLESPEVKNEVVSANEIEKISSLDKMELASIKEEETFVEPKYVFASINNRIGGKITVMELSENPIIKLNSSSSAVKSFEITYYDGFENRTEKVQGNQISPEIMYKLKKTGVNSTIYLTRIICVSDKRGEYIAPSFNFQLVGR